MTLPPLAAAAAVLLALPASAQESVDPVDLGIIKDDEVVVVQRLLYPKNNRFEVGLSAGWAAWDRYLTTPSAQLTIDVHRSESLALSMAFGAGYGLKNGTYRELEVDHGIAPYSFRYLGSALAGISWSPIYAKASISRRIVVHHDVYGALRVGATLSSSTIPDGGTPLSPTVSFALGARIFTHNNLAVRLEARDDVFLEHHKLTSDSDLRQRFMVSIGISYLTEGS